LRRARTTSDATIAITPLEVVEIVIAPGSRYAIAFVSPGKIHNAALGQKLGEICNKLFALPLIRQPIRHSCAATQGSKEG
jgi:hypothetical protein